MPPSKVELPPGQVEELKPKVFYLPDKQGRLQAVFDFSYEDFVELYKLKRQLEQKEQKPRYTLEKLIALGKAEGSHADLTVRAQIALHDAGWVRIPLRLDQGLLLEPAKYKGGGELIVQYLGGSEGYAAWLRGPTDSPHEIEMRLMAPIVSAGAEHKLKLYMPRAAISELKLVVAENPVAAQGSEGATVLPPTSSAADSSEITARGLSGDFELSWRKAGDASAPSPAVLEAVGTILERLDDRGISSEAALTLRSYGGPFDRFTVRLPQGAELTPGNNTGYTIAPLEDSQASAERGPATGEHGRLVEVRLPKKCWGRSKCISPAAVKRRRKIRRHGGICRASKCWGRRGSGALSPPRHPAIGKSFGVRAAACGRSISCRKISACPAWRPDSNISPSRSCFKFG